MRTLFALTNLAAILDATNPCEQLCQLDGPDICTGGSWPRNGGTCHGYFVQPTGETCYHNATTHDFCPDTLPALTVEAASIRVSRRRSQTTTTEIPWNDADDSVFRAPLGDSDGAFYTTPWDDEEDNNEDPYDAALIAWMSRTFSTAARVHAEWVATSEAPRDDGIFYTTPSPFENELPDGFQTWDDEDNNEDSNDGGFIAWMSRAFTTAAPVADDWTPRAGALEDIRYTTPSPLVDECARVCEVFSAADLGNGYDLCENGETSTCYYNTEIDEHVCRNLYWSVDDQGTQGLVFERDPTMLSLEERTAPLTCLVAHGLVFGPPQYHSDHVPREFSPNNLNMALHMFVNSAPVQRRLAGGIENETSAIWYMLDRFANNDTSVSVEVFDSVYNEVELGIVVGAFSLLAYHTEMVDTFAARLTPRISCTGCSFTEVSPDFIGPIPVSYMVGGNGTIGLVETLSALLMRHGGTAAASRFDCPNCHHGYNISSTFTLTHAPEILTFAVMQSRSQGHISLPLVLNLTDVIGENSLPNPIYRLYAFAENNQTATIRINDEWFISNNGTNLVPTAPVITESSIVSNSVSLVLYERV